LESIRNFLNRLLPKGSAMRHVSILAGGTTIAQGLNVAIMPVLSRIYSPADFGVMAAFSSIVAILMELSGLRYHYAIPLPKYERYAKSLVVLSFFLQAVFVVFISTVMLVFGKLLLGKISMDILIPYRYLIPVAVGGMGAYLVLTQWAIREKLFQTIARTKVTQSVSGIITKVILGLLGLRPLGLLLGSVASQAGGITTLAKSLLKEKGFPKPRREDVKRVALRYRAFPMYSTLSGLFDTLGRQIAPILFVALYSAQIGGWFSLSFQVLQLPAMLIGQAVGQVFLQKASVAKFEGNLSKVSRETFEILLELAAFPILTIAILAPGLFGFVFGDNWEMAGVFSRYLAPWVLFMFVFSPLSSLFFVMEKQREFLWFQIVNSVGRVLMVFGGFLRESPLISISLYGAFSLFFVLYILFWILEKTQNKLGILLKVSFRSLFKTSFLILPILLTNIFSGVFVITALVALAVTPFYFKNIYRNLKK